MHTLPLGRVLFGAFELDLSTGELRSTATPDPNNKVLLREQVFQVLRMLLEREGKIVTREEIKGRLWPADTVVDFDRSINETIKTLRRALGDSADNPRYIETLARRGYRLMVATEYLESAPGIAPGEAPSPLAYAEERGGLIGKKVSHYRVLDVIGGGGMGMVYRAEDLKLGRSVALKFLPQELTSDAVALQRFEREARAASSLNHPNICTIHAIEEHEAQPFIVMELLEGETLRSRMAALESKALPFNELSEVAMQVCNGLEAAHRKGIIHRDVKPANVFLCKSGVAKILDFGLAKLAGDVGLEKGEAVSATATSSADYLKRDLTRTGTTAGTAGYMSPEQVRHDELDTRTDLFSFGLVLYEMAAGQRAFTGPTVVDVHEAVPHETPVPARVRNPMLPRGFDALLAKALEKDRGQRYQSATTLKNDLERIVRSANPVRKRVRRATAAEALLALVAVGIWRFDVYRHHITLAPTDTIVLADADNQTGDPVFDDALNRALRSEMEQTPYLNILGIDKTYATLAQLKLSSTTTITPDVARQICGRTNSKMVISQSIADVGNGYHLEMRALDCSSGATLGTEQADIRSRNEVIHELGVTAVHLRARLGEPSDSLARFNQPLEKALSASLEALQAGAEGTKLYLAGDFAGALKLYQRAAELDPNLALTYGSMGAAYLSQNKIDLAEASYERGSDGVYRWFQTRARPLRDNRGKIVKWCAVANDIEDRACAEQEREKLRQLEADLAHINRVNTLGEMAASLAHEIKQPIAAAVNSANSCMEWLVHEPPNLDRARAAAARIDKYGNRAAEIIDRIRSFYKKSPPQRELLDGNGIIQEMLTLLKGEATRYSIAMRTELAAQLPKIMADRVQLQQVLMNLIMNGIEAIKDTGGVVTVKSQLGEDGQIEISVNDTGPGLPPGKAHLAGDLRRFKRRSDVDPEKENDQ